MEGNLTRAELQELADSPIGGEEARVAAQYLRPGAKVPAVLKEASKRACKIWLPGGRTSPSNPQRAEAEAALKSTQIDLEDAVEAAGGNRGAMIA